MSIEEFSHPIMNNSLEKNGMHALQPPDKVTADQFDVDVKRIGDAKGNGLFARKLFKKGETIFEEDPIVASQFLWNAEYLYLSCDFCMKPLEDGETNIRRLCKNNELNLPYPEWCSCKHSSIYCPYCKVCYCSEACRIRAWNQYHETLCLRSHSLQSTHPLVMLMETWKKIHYPPETASIMLLARIIATVRQSSNKESTVATFMKFCHKALNEEEEIAHKLLGDEFCDQLEELRWLLEKALGGSDVSHWLSPEGFRSLVALIGTNGQGIGTSPWSEWVRNCEGKIDLSEEERKKLDDFINSVYEKMEETSGTFLNSEGSGLFIIQSSCNHSCDPNATPTFPYNNFHLVMTAIKDIEEGDEICVSYLDDCNLSRSKHSRGKLLRENYIFTCRCPKCEEESGEPDVSSEEEMDDESGASDY